MICEHCGTEHGGGIQALVACRDALKDQLASMTKRAEELERENVELRKHYAAEYRFEEFCAAEAKLATAIKERDKYKAAYEREQRTHEILKSCGYDVSALGIDPSKEQGR